VARRERTTAAARTLLLLLLEVNRPLVERVASIFLGRNLGRSLVCIVWAKAFFAKMNAGYQDLYSECLCNVGVCVQGVKQGVKLLCVARATGDAAEAGV
jgi:hypothetical protein